MTYGAFLINKPSDAAFGGGNGMIVSQKTRIGQLRGEQVRLRRTKPIEDRQLCSPWADYATVSWMKDWNFMTDVFGENFELVH